MDMSTPGYRTEKDRTIRRTADCGRLWEGEDWGKSPAQTALYPAGSTSSARRPPVGASLDDEDKRRAYAAEIEALDRGQSGAPVAWRNPDSGRYGSVVPGPAYVDRGRNCRAYTETIYIDGRPQTARGTACRNPDGSWTPLA